MTRLPGSRPGRALQLRILLGPAPSLHGLCSSQGRLVRLLPSSYGQVRLLHRAHRRLRPPAFPTTSRPRRTGTAMEISRVPEQKASAHARSHGGWKATGGRQRRPASDRPRTVAKLLPQWFPQPSSRSLPALGRDERGYCRFDSIIEAASSAHREWTGRLGQNRAQPGRNDFANRAGNRPGAPISAQLVCHRRR